MKLERRKKVEATARKYISHYIIEELTELGEYYGVITVTGVRISSELSYIDVSVSALKNQENLCKDLARSAHEIHRLLAKHIDFLRVPKVRFRYDSEGKESAEIIELLHTLES